MHLEVSRVVKAPHETVYNAYTDFEAMPQWSKRLRSVRVTKREGDTVHIESTGGQRTRQGTLRLTPPDRVESRSETRFTRTVRSVSFESVPEGTKVTATLDVEVKGVWALVLSTRARKEEAEASALEELASFAMFVEKRRASDPFGANSSG